MTTAPHDPRYPYTRFLAPLDNITAREYRSTLAKLERAKPEERPALEEKLAGLRGALYAVPGAPSMEPLPLPPVILPGAEKDPLLVVVGKRALRREARKRPEPSGPPRGIVVFTDVNTEVDVYGPMPSVAGDLFQGKLRDVAASHVRFYVFNPAKMKARPHYG